MERATSGSHEPPRGRLGLTLVATLLWVEAFAVSLIALFAIASGCNEAEHRAAYCHPSSGYSDAPWIAMLCLWVAQGVALFLFVGGTRKTGGYRPLVLGALVANALALLGPVVAAAVS